MQGSTQLSYRVTAEEPRQFIERLEQLEVGKKILLTNKKRSCQTPKAAATKQKF